MPFLILKTAMKDQLNLKNMKNTLKKYGQSHILDFLERLDSTRPKSLLDQLDSLDFDVLDR